MTEKLYTYDADGLFYLTVQPECRNFIVQPVVPGLITARYTSLTVAPSYLVYVGCLALEAEGFQKMKSETTDEFRARNA